MTGSHKPTLDKFNSGFTLVEIAMVLFIVALLLGGLVPTINVQLEQQRTNETRKKISEIKDALIGFAIINGRLPCSADGTRSPGQAGYGTERTPPCTAGTAYGVVPWITLGTSETDGWGNRFTYRVAYDFADTTDGSTGACGATTAGVSFQLCSTIPANPNLLTVQSAAAGTVIASKIPVIIISHGKNGYGAYSPLGGSPPLSVPVGNTDEVANTDHISNTVYVSHSQTSGFDDLVDWVPITILDNRMVAAGKLP
ncbi:MAG: prepilin-type N-terminal cleavage/methylation domain-containing protein [Gallionella sp.]